MSRLQKYISTLLERLPKWELRSYEHQTSLDQIRDKISSAKNIQTELRSLYQVKGFADFALSLLWIADKVEKDPTMEESTLSEETFVFAKFRQGIGDESEVTEESNPVVALSGLTSGSESEGSSEPAPALEPFVDAAWTTSFQTPENSADSAAGSTQDKGQEQGFAHLLERFLESVQSGNDDRTQLLSDLINDCSSVVNSGAAAEDFKEFCRLLMEFLQYISENQFLDDIRVMNIVSNVQNPVSQWAQSEPNGRTGLLNPSIDILRDYKAMFE
jgi:hypothetical protein